MLSVIFGPLLLVSNPEKVSYIEDFEEVAPKTGDYAFIPD